MDDCTLYVVSHKKMEDEIPERTVIGVGGDRSIQGIYVYDNEGDNISEKNSNYCELTAIYWIWRHNKSKYVGIEHYRRQFLKNGRVISKSESEKILKKYDVIVTKKINLSFSVYQAYVKGNSEEELAITRNIISTKYPKYLKAFSKLSKTNKFCVCNMMITKKEVFDDYCKWLFDILFDLEKQIDISGRTERQKRMFGFLAERLLNVYLWGNKKLKVKHVKISEPILEHQTQKFSFVCEIKFLIKKLLNYRGNIDREIQ